MVEVGKKITRKDGKIYYGLHLCKDANDAYCRFRDDYHASLGKAVYRRLNMPDREERLHGFKVYFTEKSQKHLDEEFGEPSGKIEFRIMGLVGVSYCRGIDGNDLPDYDEERYARWFDWFLLHADSMMKRVGTKEKTGRTSKRLRTRYR